MISVYSEQTGGSPRASRHQEDFHEIQAVIQEIQDEIVIFIEPAEPRDIEDLRLLMQRISNILDKLVDLSSRFDDPELSLATRRRLKEEIKEITLYMLDLLDRLLYLACA